MLMIKTAGIEEIMIEDINPTSLPYIFEENTKIPETTPI